MSLVVALCRHNQITPYSGRTQIKALFAGVPLWDLLCRYSCDYFDEVALRRPAVRFFGALASSATMARHCSSVRAAVSVPLGIL